MKNEYMTPQESSMFEKITENSVSKKSDQDRRQMKTRVTGSLSSRPLPSIYIPEWAIKDIELESIISIRQVSLPGLLRFITGSSRVPPNGFELSPMTTETSSSSYERESFAFSACKEELKSLKIFYRQGMVGIGKHYDNLIEASTESEKKK